MSKVKQLIFETAFNTYRGIKQIGSGGAGVVVEVADDSNNRFAIKYLSPSGLSSERTKRFKNEMSFCASNKHKNILSVLDWGKVEIKGEKCPFYVMPYYESNLRTLVTEGIDDDKVLPYFSQILDGVEAAHLQNIWHRDLKPENILFDPSSDTLVVADFGIARFAEPKLQTLVETKPSARLANFQYAAPEQRQRDTEVGNQADIYALGLILNEMFTGKLALGVDFMRIGDVTEQYTYLDGIIDLMLSQSPSRRPSSIAEIKKQLISQENEFIALQRLSELTRQVIPENEIDDTLVTNPPFLVDASWKDGFLTMKLSQHVNTDWIQCFQHPGSYEAVWGKGPETFQFRGNQIIVESNGDDAQRLINYTKKYIQKANARYKYEVERDAEEQEKAMKEELKRNIKLEEKTRDINLNLEI